MIYTNNTKKDVILARNNDEFRQLLNGMIPNLKESSLIRKQKVIK